MPGKFHHEQLYRGDALERLAAIPIVICGAGALGSHLADNLARHGARRLSVIDHDRVEEHNVSTQLYGESEVGLWKVEALRNRLFRATGVELEATRRTLGPSNAAKLLAGAGLIIDAFDNHAARKAVQEAVRAAGLECLHVGLAADYAEIVWDVAYIVPPDPAAGDACDYPLARNTIVLAVAVASEAILRRLAGGPPESHSVTLLDFRVTPVTTAG